VPSADDIFENLATAIVVLGADRTILRINAAAETLFGLSRKQAVGSRPAVLIPELQPLEPLLERAMETGQSFGRHLSFAIPHRDFDTVEAACCVSLLTDAGPRCVVMEFFDATAWRQLDREKALVAQRAASRRIIRQLAHEIRNPLGGLRGAAQLLQRRLPDPELAEYTRVIIGEADRLVALTENLLGPTREPDLRHMNIHEPLDRVVLLIENEAPEGVSIVRDYDPSLPGIALDRDQIVQAFLNIARNAIQSVGTTGRVTVRTRALTNHVVGTRKHRLILSVEFEDDGPGIAPEIADSIFYPLVTDRAGGTGLGLPLAQDLVSRHGGLIEFESSPGRTRFMVRLPLERTESIE